MTAIVEETIAPASGAIGRVARVIGPVADHHRAAIAEALGPVADETEISGPKTAATA